MSATVSIILKETLCAVNVISGSSLLIAIQLAFYNILVIFYEKILSVPLLALISYFVAL